MTDQESRDQDDRLAVLIERARAATSELRDAARLGHVIDFRQRDPLVVAIHDALDELEAAASALRAVRSPLPVCGRCLGAGVDTYVNPDSPTGYTERDCPACAASVVRSETPADGGVAETLHRHSLACRQQEARRTREALVLEFHLTHCREHEDGCTMEADLLRLLEAEAASALRVVRAEHKDQDQNPDQSRGGTQAISEVSSPPHSPTGVVRATAPEKPPLDGKCPKCGYWPVSVSLDGLYYCPSPPEGCGQYEVRGPAPRRVKPPRL